MTDFKHKSKEQLSRDDAAQRLIALGQALASGEALELGAEGKQHSVRVADELRWEYETKSRRNRVEIEVELSWEQPNSAAPPIASDPQSASLPSDAEARSVPPSPPQT